MLHSLTARSAIIPQSLFPPLRFHATVLLSHFGDRQDLGGRRHRHAASLPPPPAPQWPPWQIKHYKKLVFRANTPPRSTRTPSSTLSVPNSVHPFAPRSSLVSWMSCHLPPSSPTYFLSSALLGRCFLCRSFLVGFSLNDVLASLPQLESLRRCAVCTADGRRTVYTWMDYGEVQWCCCCTDRSAPHGTRRDTTSHVVRGPRSRRLGSVQYSLYSTLA